MYDEKYELDLHKILTAINRFKRTGIIVALVVMAIMVFGNQVIFPDQYEASSLVRVKMDNILNDNRHNLVQIVQEEILSRSILEDVIRQLNLDQPSNEKTPIQRFIETVTRHETTMKPESIDNIVRDLKTSVSVAETTSNSGGTNLFVVSMKDNNPENVAEIVNAIVNTYINHKLAGKAEDTQQLVEFLKGQVEKKRRELVLASKKLELFKNTNSEYLDSESSVSQALYNARLRLVAAESRIAQNTALVNDTKEAILALPQTISTNRNVNPNNLSPRQRMVFLKQKLADYLTRFTDDHPDVIQVKQKIRTLELQLYNSTDDEEINNTAEFANPEYLRLRSILATAKSDLKSAAAEASLIKEEIGKLGNVRSKLPQVSQILTALETTKENFQRDYRNLKTRLTEVSIQSQAVMTEVGSNFIVVDPAVTPTSPTIRSRLMLHLFGVALGIGLGISSSLILGVIIPKEKETQKLGIAFIILTIIPFMLILGFIGVDFLNQSIIFV